MRWRWLAAGAVVLAVAALAGCSTVRYYGQAISGHLAILNAAKPVDSWLQNPDTPAALRARLKEAQEIRRYAVTALDLPDNASYTRYADLHRDAAVWNVTAAPVDSLRLKRWCFLVAGCVPYRGYYHEAAAEAFAATLRAQGLEVAVYGVPAYSTLGRLNWLGGDPLLSTFVGFPPWALAHLLFHELAHQKVYLAGDAEFNESFADTVAELGVHDWMQTHGRAALRAQAAVAVAHKRDFDQLALGARKALAAIYARRDAEGETQVLADKAAEMARFRADYAALKARWRAEGHPFDGYDAWVAQANNARFGMLATYDGLIPAFRALYAQEGGNWPRFYQAVQDLADLPAAERSARLKALAATAPAAPAAPKATLPRAGDPMPVRPADQPGAEGATASGR